MSPLGRPKRSPIKGHVSRQAGQGLKEYLDNYSTDEILKAILPLTFMLFWGSIELLHRYTPGKPTPLWVIGLLIAATLLHCVVRLKRCRDKMRKLCQGIDGEKYVSQIIERDLLSDGYRVVHDIPFETRGRKFNIDHLVIGPNGVFCIETKTWSKPFRGETVATYDGSKILLNGVKSCGNAIDQARALAKMAEERIGKLAGISVKVNPFVVCVGWYIRKHCTTNPDVCVVNEEALAAFIKAHAGTLDATVVDRIWQQLKDAQDTPHLTM